MTRRHQHRHRFAESPSDTQEDRTEQAVLRGGKNDLANDLPAGGAHRFGCLAIAIGYGLECIFRDRRHDGRCHEPQDDACIEDV